MSDILPRILSRGSLVAATRLLAAPTVAQDFNAAPPF